MTLFAAVVVSADAAAPEAPLVVPPEFVAGVAASVADDQRSTHIEYRAEAPGVLLIVIEPGEPLMVAV
jgi:hypothetical protein